MRCVSHQLVSFTFWMAVAIDWNAALMSRPATGVSPPGMFSPREKPVQPVRRIASVQRMYVSYFTGPASVPAAMSRGWRRHERRLPPDRDIDVRVFAVVRLDQQWVASVEVRGRRWQQPAQSERRNARTRSPRGLCRARSRARSTHRDQAAAPELMRDDARLRREARAMARLSHPNRKRGCSRLMLANLLWPGEDVARGAFELALRLPRCASPCRSPSSPAA